MTRAAQPLAQLSRRGLRWALEGIVCQRLTVARVAEALGVSWNAPNDAVLAEGQRVLIVDPGRFDGVAVSTSTSRHPNRTPHADQHRRPPRRGPVNAFGLRNPINQRRRIRSA
jgi:hypothetical protein